MLKVDKQLGSRKLDEYFSSMGEEFEGGKSLNFLLGFLHQKLSDFGGLFFCFFFFWWGLYYIVYVFGF